MDASQWPEFRQFVARGGYDFFDFGCGAGRSIAWAQRKLGGRKGLGIDKSPAKLEAARAAGFDAVDLDILEMPRAKMVRFTLMRHFLEHLPHVDLAGKILWRACQVSREFVLVAQPYFDADGLLAQQGLKLYWSHWGAHPNRMTSLDFYRCLAHLKERGIIRHFAIHFRGPIHSSDDVCVHPLASPRDQHDYDPAKHPAKPSVSFKYPIFREIVVIVGIESRPDPEIARRIKAGAAFYEA